MSDRKQQIARHFGAAAPTYDHAARIQARIAEQFAGEIAALTQPARILEFGCGTGNLTLALTSRFPNAHLIATDLTPPMTALCRKRLGTSPRLSYAAMDAELPASAPAQFDLVGGSLAAQWFAKPAHAFAALGTLLRPGGVLALTTLGSDTFQEWRAAAAMLGLDAAIPAYPSLAELDWQRPRGFLVETAHEQRLWDEHPSALDFLQSLRRIGADLPADDARPLSPGALRRILRQVDAKGHVNATYHVLTVLWRKS
ncbi:methyltransferase domain-containing protein [Dongia deserti]|uniref:methyltransferase domain-containing protein n=1 Tax=Dongia deserti TaxID=2268030 RepID=UPI0013C50A9F|nr:methyltransferase domain-containing protein [Dongia deserti]